MCLSELSALAGTDVTYNRWSVDAVVVPKAASPAASATSVTPVSLEQHEDLAFAAAHAGFKIDTIVYEKKIGAKREHLYKITSVNAAITEMKNHCPYDDIVHTVTVETPTVLADWVVYKSDNAPYKMDETETRCESLEVDCVKADIFKILYEAGKDCNEQLRFFAVLIASWLKPSSRLESLSSRQ